ncbi:MULTISPECIES: LysR family transcriptional regulator [unclassified Devosia]|uniref:LysR family transcriptional regulator n=1 Tax=unclassified Devosia TaxID=196773 RepID=UPI001552E683|nr:MULTISPECIES: LysR family transcriptional regulator [unclassified Devosia]
MDRDTWGDMAVLAAIVEAGGFSRAAPLLGVSASALSHRVKALENRLGVRLLNRTTRSVAPTEAGERLLARLRPAIAEIDLAIADLDADRGRPSGRVRVTTHRSAAFELVLPKLRRFSTDYPEIVVELVIDDGLVDIVAAGFDAGIRRAPSLEKDMVSIRLDEGDTLYVVAAPSYIARFGTPQHPQDLTGHNCLNFRYPSARFIHRWTFERDGQTLALDAPGTFVTSDNDLLLACAREGVGVTIVLQRHVAPYLASGELVRVLEDWHYHVPPNHLYYAGRLNQPPALRAFIDAMKAP